MREYVKPSLLWVGAILMRIWEFEVELRINREIWDEEVKLRSGDLASDASRLGLPSGFYLGPQSM